MTDNAAQPRVVCGCFRLKKSNSSAVLTYNQAFNPGGTWLVPTSVVQARFAKLSATFDF